MRGRLELRIGRAAFGALAFAPDGRTLAVASHPLTATQHPDTTRFATIHIFELATGRVRQQFQGHRGPIQRLTFSADSTSLASGGADTTILIWDTNGRPKSPATLTAAQVDEIWETLAAPDAAAAYQAMGRLLGAPAQALALLKTRLRPVPVVVLDESKIPQWIADLDSQAFERRQAAARALEQFGRPAVPTLRKAQAEATSLEARRRLTDLLERIQSKIIELREGRALELLERLDGRDAEDLLANLARGSPAAPLTEEAAKALARRR